MAAEWRQPKHISMQFKIIFLLWGKNYIREVVSLNPSTSYWMDLFHITFLYCLIVKTGKKRIEAENGPFKNILDWLADKAVKGVCVARKFENGNDVVNVDAISRNSFDVDAAATSSASSIALREGQRRVG